LKLSKIYSQMGGAMGMMSNRIFTGKWRGKQKHEPRSKYIGRVDRLYQSDLAGWAVSPDGRPCEVEIRVNGNLIAQVGANLIRPDLAAIGLSPAAGFQYTLPEPLSQSDEITIHFPDGVAVPGSETLTYKERLRRLLTGIDLQRKKGLEIGALDKPILSKNGAKVLFVDHANTASLKEKYKDSPRNTMDIERIVDVDIVWSAGALSEALPADEKFGYCIASHVIEHVADPIGWLGELSAILEPEGIISLAIPERSRTFDHCRAVSQPADLIGAFIEKRRRPTARQIFDCKAFMSDLSERGTKDSQLDVYKLRSALWFAVQSEDSDAYFDVHCNVFTVESFMECWAVIKALELLPLELEKCFEPQENTDEFIVILRKG
jgi:2-polyprenyl-3-methyl-5-hydroxy-6-metoxy-1,4-benzoquinol methylase